jgi:hypothetical protein
LQRVIDAWPYLSEDTRRVILAMVEPVIAYLPLPALPPAFPPLP